MNKALRASSLPLLMALTLGLSACGGGNSTAGPAPNAGNIPNLAVRPSSQASALKKVRLTGTVFNSYTNAPIEKAEITIQVLSAPTAGSSATPPATGSTPAPIPTAPPTGGAPVSTPFPTMVPGGTPPVGSTPIPAPSAVPSSQPTLPPPGINPGDVPPADGPVPPGAGLPQNLPQSLAIGGSRTEVFRATGAAFQIAQAASASPANGEGPNVFLTDTNNKGKFFQNDVPDGRMVLTISAPGYRTLTLTEVNPTSLEIPLTPLDGTKSINVVGMVLSATEKPVADAIVSPSFIQGEGVGIPSTTNELGEFELYSVAYGTHSLIAFTLDEDQRIKQMGVLAAIPISDKTLKVKKPALPSGDTPNPTPKPSQSSAAELLNNVEQIITDEESAEASSSAGTAPKFEDAPDDAPEASPKASPAASTAPLEVIEENQEETQEESTNLFDALRSNVTEFFTGEKPQDSVENVEIYPVVPLRSVLSDVVFAGTVDVPEGYTAENLDVYLSLPPVKKGEPPQEVFLYSQPLRAAAPAASASASPAPAASASPAAPTSARFRAMLPNLEKGQSYHLQLTASKEGGERSYNHVYNLNASNEELKVQFMPATPKIEIEGEEVNAVPPVPGFGWSAVSGAELYHVSLEEGTGDKRRVVWEAWTKETEIKYPLSSRSQRLRERRSYTVSVEALKGLRPANNDQKKQYALPAYRAIWTDLSRVTHAPFEVVE